MLNSCSITMKRFQTAFSSSWVPKPGQRDLNTEKNLGLWYTSGFSMTSCLVHLVWICGTLLRTKVPKFVILFKVKYLVTEGIRYPNPHCPDYLDGNPCHCISQKDQQCSWLRSEWNFWPTRVEFVVFCHLSYWHLHNSIFHRSPSVCRNGTGCKISNIGELQFSFGSYEAWFCHVASLVQNFGLLWSTKTTPYVIFGIEHPN